MGRQGIWLHVNRTRKALRPDEPRDIDFRLDLNHIGPDFRLDLNHIGPDFVQGDLRVDGQRHVILATPQMLQLLSRCNHL